MAEIVALCGVICSGKSTYAEKMKRTCNAVVLNPDVLIKALFDERLGECHDDIFEKVRWYLYRQAYDISQTGIDVILDFGLWSKKERREVREFFGSKNAEFSVHYIDTPLAKIRANIDKRNSGVDESDYFIDDAIFDKCLSLFEVPDEDEIDVSVQFDG